ncbi:helix-turn-helix domain-containing protein [Enterococcus quebecensis]|uniref:Mga helix-turn-helix domain-containing protein n=1 Tax=Enterococcus quebecensis TaxID=903983 RepID=A0A1E5GUI2_9ENTE|nr:helix-turn-helix domain-containing protein [Enterococcus quebecensis]OEG16331.1 hypothetical protein BCR23_05430 [Enterococcus quebecensis]
MNSINKQKYDLFVFIYFSEENVCIKNITNYFRISATSATRNIREVNEDLLTIFKDDRIKIARKNNLYYLQNKTNKPAAYITDKVRLEYFKDTDQFKIIEALLKKRFHSVKSLANYLHISTPHLYKAIKKINTNLEKFEVNISFQNPSKFSNFTSKKEMNMRIFLYYYYWHFYKGLEWPFKSLLEPNVTKSKILKTFTYSQIQRFNYLTSLSNCRIYSRKQHIKLDDESLIDLTPFKQVNDFSLALVSDTYKIPEQILEEEKVFFNFLTRFYIEDCDDKEQKINIASQFLNASTPLTIYTKKLLKKLFSAYHIDVPKDVWLLSYYNLNTIFLYLKYINLDYSDWYRTRDGLSNQASHNPVLEIVEKKFISYFTNTFTDLPPPFKITDGMIKYVAHYLHYLIDSNLKVEPIKICVQYGRLFYLNDQIKHTINLTFQSKNISYVDTPEKADLIISDSYQGENDTATYFFLYDTNDESNWKAMITTIKKMFYKKVFMTTERLEKKPINEISH